MATSKFVPVGKLLLGKLDAYSECLEYGPETYQTLFYACPSFHVEKFLNGKAYFIHGDKGVGKTALLKHLEIIAINEASLVDYIRFKKDVDQEERNALKRASIPNNSFEEVVEKNIPDDAGINCIYAWQVYMIKCIVNLANASECAFFEDNESWRKLNQLIKSAYNGRGSVAKSIIPKVKRGSVKLDVIDGVALDIDFEWDNPQEKTVSFSTYAKKVIELFGNLRKNPDASKMYLLFDELELVHFHKKSYMRDVTLIRDLIQAIYYINEISKTSGFDIFSIACFRNEVYRNIAAVGYEINKIVQDYGVEISWLQSGGSIVDNPLIKMLVNRLLKSQEGENQEVSEADIWKAYFDEYVNINYNNQTAMNYIVDQTWCKPRDIIRLFNLIQKKYEYETRINTMAFESVRKSYSHDSWEEFSNELSAKYTPLEIDGIKQVLIGINVSFSIGQFSERIEEKKIYFESVRKLSEKYTAVEILSDIYRVGIIGTDGKWKRFYFKGDIDFDTTSNAIIHYPLRRFFST